MPTPTYDLIASNVLTGSVSSVTFSSIPSTYRDLVLVANLTSTISNGGIAETVNSDTGANYFTVLFEGGGGVRGIARTRNDILHSWFTGNITNSHPATHITQYFDYAATDKHKAILVSSGSRTQTMFRSAVRWASLSAITSITIGTSDVAVGSSFHLYGIVA